MSSYFQVFYHIVFSTRKRENSLQSAKRPELFKYITGVIRNKKGKLYQINGMEDHLHIYCSLHPTVCLSDLVKDIKVSSNNWIKENCLFTGFKGWQDGYGAFTHTFHEKNVLVNYIKNQQEHHRKVDFKEEFLTLLREHGIVWDHSISEP